MATLTMADRSALSPVGSGAAPGLAGLFRAISLTGIRVGDVISSTVPWAKANPVIAPHVLRLTSAVACCHVGFLTGCTDHLLPRLRAGQMTARRLLWCRFPAPYLALGSVLRIAWTCGFPGLLALANSTLTS